MKYTFKSFKKYAKYLSVKRQKKDWGQATF